MFRKIISESPLITNEANEFFHNINGMDYHDDNSFLATLRVLLANRVSENDYIFVESSSGRHTAADIASRTTREAVKRILHTGYMSPGTIHVHSFSDIKPENNMAAFELIKSSFTDVYPTWQRLEKVTDFYIKSFNVLCFIEPETKCVAIFVEKLNIQKWHHLQCSIFAFMPWFFSPEKGVSEDEMELIKSLEEKTPEKYEACIAKFASQFDFRARKIKKLLANFEISYEHNEIIRVTRKIDDILRSIRRREDEIAELFRQKNDENIRLLGLETKVAQSTGDSELMEYFLCNSKLHLETVYDGEMTFAVKNYLEYYDEDAAKTVINNDSSYVYLRDGHDYIGISKSDMKILMTAIFIDQKIKVKFCAAYRFKINGSVTPCSHHDFSNELRECMPNPHINDFACLGNYRGTINELLKNNNYIGALEQCIASSKSLNFHDSPVMKMFMKLLYSTHRKCIELPDGTNVEPTDAIKWLNEQQEGANNEQNN